MSNRSAKLRDSKLVIQGVITLGFKFSSAGWGIVISIILARLLGPKEFGVYIYLMALVSLFSVPGAFGLPMLLTREIPAYRIRSQPGHIRGIVTASFVLALLVSVLFGVVVVVLAYTTGDAFVRNAVASNWTIIVLLLVSMTLGTIRAGVVRGLDRVLLAQLPEVFVSPIIFLLGIGAFAIIWKITLSASLALRLQFCATFAAFVVGTAIMVGILSTDVAKVARAYDLKRWVQTAFPFLLAGGAQVVNAKLDVAMVGSMLGSVSAGLYQISTKGADVLLLIYLAFGTVAGPRLAELQARKDMESVQRLLTVGVRWLNTGSLALAIVLIAFGPWLLNTIYGAAYAGAYKPLAILCGFRVGFSFFGLCDLTLQMLGSGPLVARTLAMATGANLVLNFLLIPRYGTAGAAMATGVTLTSWNAYLSYRLRRSFGLSAHVFAKGAK